MSANESGPIELSPEELIEILPAEMAEYLFGVDPLKLMDPNNALGKAYAGRLETYELLARNAAIYDDETEEFIDSSPMMETLFRERSANLQSDSHVQAIRVGRGVIARVLWEAVSIEQNIGPTARAS